MHIQLSTWLVVPASLLLPTVTAFYPYHYGDDSTPTSRTRRTPQLSSSHTNTNAKSITFPIRRVPTPIHPRQNAYNIVNSKDPTQDNSVAIDQDGHDLSYMVAVTFGDSKEEYHLLLDSAASNTWVMSQDCKSDACSTHTLFGAGDSSTLKTQTDPFTITYGTGTVSGILAQDTLHMGSLSSSLTFGLATNVSEEFSFFPMDGLLGIGRGTQAKSNTPQTPQIMDVLTSTHLIGSKLYAIHLSRSPMQDGEFNLGAVNPARFDGDLNWNTCLDSPTGFWEIAVTDAHVSGQSLGLTNRTAIMDTGTSFMLLPPADALAIHSKIRGFTQSGETFSVPCDTTAVVQFAFNQQLYNISTSDWIGDKLASGGLCRSNIVGRQTFNSTQWLVGDVFFKNVYSVFDFDGGRVGLGVKRAETKESGQQQVSSSSSASAAVAAATAATTTTSGATSSSTGVAQSQGENKNSSGVSGSSSVLVLFAGVVSILVSISSFM